MGDPDRWEFPASCRMTNSAATKAGDGQQDRPGERQDRSSWFVVCDGRENRGWSKCDAGQQDHKPKAANASFSGARLFARS
jgi:hypothetical protein